MKYKLYRMNFTSPVHFGEGHLGGSSENFLADRLFSALYIEAMKSGADAAEKLLNAVSSGELLLSDGLPYIGNELYIPKPVIRIDSGESSSVLKKAFKKLSYIPVSRIDEFLKGRLDPQAENEILRGLGKSADTTRAAVRNGTDDALPYRVGTYSFFSGSGLYFMAGYTNDEVFAALDDAVMSLGYTGIGGKVSSGLGKFSAFPEEVPEEMLKLLTGDHDRYITLSVSMARDEQLEKALVNAGYMLVKRSGFINSQTYSDTQRKKREMYCFAAGSCFENRFEGYVADLSDGGSHPVYRYAVPMFMGVDLP